MSVEPESFKRSTLQEKLEVALLRVVM
uniref:Uncharacterized protein n=1 Tax=Rhizophora mucronata TaxID=61149 RepID=A0A2P2NN72_RHIMU